MTTDRPQRMKLADVAVAVGECRFDARVIELAKSQTVLLADGSGALWGQVNPQIALPPVGTWCMVTGSMTRDAVFRVSSLEPYPAPHHIDGALGCRQWQSRHWKVRRYSLRRRQLFRTLVREFFERRGYLEVETPTLLSAPGQELHLTPFTTSFVGQPRYLATSPEYAHKRLLSAGFDRIFELARSYRSGLEESSRWHEPEFALLEWYRAYSSLEDLMEEVEQLIRSVTRGVSGGFVLRHQTHWCDVALPFERLSMRQAFARYAKLDLEPFLQGDDEAFLRALGETPTANEGDLAEDANQRFFHLFVTEVEPHLGLGRPTFLVDFPARHAALAEIQPTDPRVARRFELYLCGLELANAFQELRDAVEQERRLREEQQLRRRATGELLPLNEEFLQALRAGIPPTAGIALGLDRWLALLLGMTQVADVIAFPHGGSTEPGTLL